MRVRGDGGVVAVGGGRGHGSELGVVLLLVYLVLLLRLVMLLLLLLVLLVMVLLLGGVGDVLAVAVPLAGDVVFAVVPAKRNQIMLGWVLVT